MSFEIQSGVKQHPKKFNYRIRRTIDRFTNSIGVIRLVVVGTPVLLLKSMLTTKGELLKLEWEKTKNLVYQGEEPVDEP